LCSVSFRIKSGRGYLVVCCVLSHSPQTGLYYGTGTICLHLVVFASSCVLSHSESNPDGAI
jgi:hypothetical protein